MRSCLKVFPSRRVHNFVIKLYTLNMNIYEEMIHEVDTLQNNNLTARISLIKNLVWDFGEECVDSKKIMTHASLLPAFANACVVYESRAGINYNNPSQLIKECAYAKCVHIARIYEIDLWYNANANKFCDRRKKKLNARKKTPKGHNFFIFFALTMWFFLFASKCRMRAIEIKNNEGNRWYSHYVHTLHNEAQRRCFKIDKFLFYDH